MSEKSEIAKRQDPVVPAFNVNAGDLPNLHKDGKIIPVDLGAEYWSPEAEGELRLGFIQAIETHEYQDQNDPEKIIKLPTMVMIAQKEDGSAYKIKNASKRLVAEIERNFEEGKIVPGNPLQITYTGEKKNKTNSFKSNTWSIKPIQVNATA